MNKDYKLRYVFPLIGKDFLKMIVGLSVSVGIVLSVSYTHLRAHETEADLVCRLLLEKKNNFLQSIWNENVMYG